MSFIAECKYKNYCRTDYYTLTLSYELNKCLNTQFPLNQFIQIFCPKKPFCPILFKLVKYCWLIFARKGGEHTAYDGMLRYLFCPMSKLVRQKISQERGRYLFAPWVVPVLGGPRAVGFPCRTLPHWLRPVCTPAHREIS